MVAAQIGFWWACSREQQGTGGRCGGSTPGGPALLAPSLAPLRRVRCLGVRQPATPHAAPPHKGAASAAQPSRDPRSNRHTCSFPLLDSPAQHRTAQHASPPGWALAAWPPQSARRASAAPHAHSRRRGSRPAAAAATAAGSAAAAQRPGSRQSPAAGQGAPWGGHAHRRSDAPRGPHTPRAHSERPSTPGQP